MPPNDSVNVVSSQTHSVSGSVLDGLPMKFLFKVIVMNVSNNLPILFKPLELADVCLPNSTNSSYQ